MPNEQTLCETVLFVKMVFFVTFDQSQNNQWESAKIHFSRHLFLMQGLEPTKTSQ